MQKPENESLRIAKEEVIQKHDCTDYAKIDCYCPKGECRYMGNMSQPIEEATETQEGAALSWLQYIEGFPKIKELWESLSKSQPVMAKLFEININNFVDSQRKPK